MTNEEKAREIINCGDWCESINKCDYKNTGVNCYAYGIAMRMAEWKDDYYKKMLDLLIKSGADPNIITNYIKNCIEI